MKRGALVLALLVLASGPAAAQGVAAPAAPSPSIGRTEGGAARDLDAKLTRLLELLGSVQFLRQLCDPTETTRWRERAALLIDAEGETDARRERLTASFNRGYRAFAAYRECTDNALFALDRFTVEGERLTRDILVRYGE